MINKSPRSYLPFVLIMLMVGLLVTAISIGLHYRTSMAIEVEKIVELIESQTRLIASVARFDARHNEEDYPFGAKEATLNQLKDTLSQRIESSRTGEVLLGHKDKLLNFVLDISPTSISSVQPLSGVTKQALTLALSGQSGHLFGIDHRGQQVLAAYTYLADLDRGLVAKVDMQELREPFVNASLLASSVAIILVIMGTILIKQVRQLNTSKPQGVFTNYSGIKEYERYIYLIIIMTIICIAVNLSSAITLYLSSYNRSQDHLLNLVTNQSRLIDSVSRFDQKYSRQDHPKGATGATLSQVIDAYSQSLGFSDTGEYLIGHRVGDHIEMIFHQRHREDEINRIAFTSKQAMPIRQALAGLKGISLIQDHHGQDVLAAYIPILNQEYGLVAKMDLAEIRQPYIRTSLVTTSLALFITMLASVILARMTQPFRDLNQGALIDKATLPSTIPISLLFFTSCLAIGIFILDLITPAGIAGGAPYVAVVAMGWWFPQRKHILFIALIVSLLTLSVFLTGSEFHEWKSIINRSYSLFVIWVTALILNLAKASEIARFNQANSLKKLSLAVEHSPTGVMITDTDGNIEYVNPRFLDNTEYQVDDLIGQNPRLLNSGETPDSVFKEMWGTIKSGKEWRGEIINRKKNGELFWEETSIYPIVSEVGDLQNFVCIKENITQRKQAEVALQHEATHDALTGLANASLGKDRLKKSISRSRREKDKTALLFIDLDGFKNVNDTFGHEAGDHVLIEVAKRLKHSIREMDTAARIGGDEFVIILTDIIQQSDVEGVADKIINAIRDPYLDINNAIQLGSSIGIALYPDHGDDPDTLVKCADIAMYAVKRSGKNNYQFFKG